MMDISRDVLTIKRKIIEKNTKDNLYPYSKYYLRTVNERLVNIGKIILIL